MANRWQKASRKKAAAAPAAPTVQSYGPAAPVNPVPATADAGAVVGLCKAHPFYTGSRPPLPNRNTGAVCDLCWCVYNALHDLPIGNRLARSAFAGGARLSRLIPPVESGFEATRTVYHRRSDALTLPLQILYRNDLVVTSVGLDLSPTSTGVAVLGYYESPEALGGKRWLALTYTVGASCAQDATVRERIERQVMIASSIIHTLRLVYKHGSDGGMPAIRLEDHAYEAGGARVHDMIELHGTIKSQIYLTFRLAPETVPIQEAPATVHHHGGCRKAEARRNFLAAGWAWVDKITDDEIDALTIALGDTYRRFPISVAERLATDTFYYQATDMRSRR